MTTEKYKEEYMYIMQEHRKKEKCMYIFLNTENKT